MAQDYFAVCLTSYEYPTISGHAFIAHCDFGMDGGLPK